MVPLLSGSNWGNSVQVEGFESGPDIDSNSRMNEVGPGYFKTVGIPVLAGREFTRADAVGSGKVAIVNETMAAKFWPGDDPIGKIVEGMRQAGKRIQDDEACAPFQITAAS